MLSVDEKQESLSKFVEILRFPTVSATGPIDGSYINCSKWILSELIDLGFEAAFLPEALETKPIIVGTWKGTNPDLGSILLNSHYDVVPVVPEDWTVPPFEGFRREGKIYGRGTQDMKCVCVQYLIALKKLKLLKFQPTRTINISFVPDEEIGGADGMNILTASAWFTNLKIDLALDEGLASTDEGLSVFYGERLPWWIKIKANGNTGHGSRFIEATAVEQVIGVVNKALDFRQEQKDILHGKGHHAGCSHAVVRKKAATLGDVTSLNVTMLRAGVQAGGKDVINVVPPTAEAGFDIRISPHVEPIEIQNKIEMWCQEVNTSIPNLGPGQGLSWEFIYDPLKAHSTTSTSEENPWWNIFSKILKDSFDIEVTPEVFPAATDSRFLRALGVKAFGFSPIRKSPILLHENDEYIEESVFLEGCEIYIKLIEKLASVNLI